MQLHDDEDLRALFGELRSQERSKVPSFRRMDLAPESPRHAWRPAIAIAFVLLVVIAGAVVVKRRVAPAPAVVSHPVVVRDWKGPTDFLLQTPQAELLRSVPRFGSPLPSMTKKGT